MISHDARRVDNSNHFICLMPQLLLATIVTNYVLTDKESDDSVIFAHEISETIFSISKSTKLDQLLHGSSTSVGKVRLERVSNSSVYLCQFAWCICRLQLYTVQLGELTTHASHGR